MPEVTGSIAERKSLPQWPTSVRTSRALAPQWRKVTRSCGGGADVQKSGTAVSQFSFGSSVAGTSRSKDNTSFRIQLQAEVRDAPDVDAILEKIKTLDGLARETIASYFKYVCPDCNMKRWIGESCVCIRCATCKKELQRADSRDCDWCARTVCGFQLSDDAQPLRPCLERNVSDVGYDEYICVDCASSLKRACNECGQEKRYASDLVPCSDCREDTCRSCWTFLGTDNCVCKSCASSWGQCPSCVCARAQRQVAWNRFQDMRMSCPLCDQEVCTLCLDVDHDSVFSLCGHLNCNVKHLRHTACGEQPKQLEQATGGDQETYSTIEAHGDALQLTPCQGLVKLPACLGCITKSSDRCSHCKSYFDGRLNPSALQSCPCPSEKTCTRKLCSHCLEQLFPGHGVVVY